MDWIEKTIFFVLQPKFWLTGLGIGGFWLANQFLLTFLPPTIATCVGFTSIGMLASSGLAMFVLRAFDMLEG